MVKQKYIKEKAGNKKIKSPLPVKLLGFHNDGNLQFYKF